MRLVPTVAKNLFLACVVVLVLCGSAPAQRKKTSRPPAKTPAVQPVDELSKLHDEYIKATKDYKASLQKLLALYQESVKKAEQKRDQTQKLFAAGLIARVDLEKAELAVTNAGVKVSETNNKSTPLIRRSHKCSLRSKAKNKSRGSDPFAGVR